jgi:hypothetical protein
MAVAAAVAVAIAVAVAVAVAVAGWVTHRLGHVHPKIGAAQQVGLDSIHSALGQHSYCSG